MKAVAILVCALIASGCTALVGRSRSDQSSDGGLWADRPITEGWINILRPTGTEVFSRDQPRDDEWIARVEIEIESVGIDLVTLSLDAVDVSTLQGGHVSTRLSLRTDGEHIVRAWGVRPDGVSVESSVRIAVTEPEDQSCHGQLDSLGLVWRIGSAVRGIGDPVRIESPIRGVQFQARSASEPGAILMDCNLAPGVAASADLARSLGFDKIIHIGVYNYRCIDGGDPDVDGCAPSMHAKGLAIDFHEFINTTTGFSANVLNDFVITRRSDTCPMASSTEADRLLKQVACDLFQNQTFNIVLTPNYNEEHRNHFHVDMTEAQHFLGSGIRGLDPLWGGPFGD